MGNSLNQEEKFNILDINDLKKLIKNINKLDGFFIDTNLALSSKCLVVLNNLINYYDQNVTSILAKDHSVSKNLECEIFPDANVKLDQQIIDYLDKLKTNFKFIRHLSIFNSCQITKSIDEFIRLDNFSELLSLHIENISIRYLHHLKFHRESLIKLTVHGNLGNLEELVELCGGDQSFSGAWINLKYLDLKFNHLKRMDQSVSLLTALTVLDISRNEIEDISFIKDIPTLVCLNASFNRINIIPNLKDTHNLQALLLGYNCLDGIEGIRKFSYLSTLDVSYNIISSTDYLQQLKEMDILEEIILRGNPISFSKRYRYDVLNIISLKVPDTFSIDNRQLSRKEERYLRKTNTIKILPSYMPSMLTQATDSSTSIRILNKNDENINHVTEITPTPTRRNIRRGNIDSQSHFPSNYEISPTTSPGITTATTTSNILKNNFQAYKEPKMNIDEEVEYSSGVNTDKSLQETFVDVKPYYIGPKTSSVYVTNHKMFDDSNFGSYSIEEDDHALIKHPYFGISIQIIDNRLMLVDQRNVVVDSTDIRLLLLIHEVYEANELVLIFIEEQIKKDSESNELFLMKYQLICESASEIKNIFDQLMPQIASFKVICEIDRDDNCDSFPLDNVTLKCSHCQFNLTINASDPDNHRFQCLLCEKTIFVLHKLIGHLNKTPLTCVANQNKDQNPSQAISRQNQHGGSSGGILKSTMIILNNSSVQPMDGIVEEEVVNHVGDNEIDDSYKSKKYDNDNAFDDENDCITETCTESYATAQDMQSPSETADFFSPPDENFYTDSTREDPSTMKDNLETPVTNRIGDEIFDKAMKIKTIISHNEEKSVFDWLKKCGKSEWIIEEPMSNIRFYMQNSSKKMDDRIKMYFLARVLKNDEDIKAAYKVFIIQKFPSKFAIQTLLIISDKRIMLYEWMDKTSENLEECIKFIGEHKLKNFIYLEYSVNNQWLEVQTKNKYTILIFVGDSESTKMIGASISEAVMDNVTRFGVKSLKKLENLKCYPQLLEQLQQKIPNLNSETLQNTETYMIQSSSLPINLSLSEIEYVVRFLIIESENLFFVQLIYPNKDSQQPHMIIDEVISLFHLGNKLKVYEENGQRCELIICENNQETSIDIEFMSPLSRTNAILRISELHRELYQVDINLEKVSRYTALLYN